MKKYLQLILLIFILLASGCAYKHYMGLHGPSIKAFPDIHENVTQDIECLACHHPDKKTQGTATSHPGFKGCFKCHND
jgi:hypothetical protein